MKLEIGQIKPNPFKKHINGGKLNPEGIEKMKESIEHGTLPEIFVARKYGDDYQLSFGHHRLEALKQVKGRNYKVDVNVVNYSDEMMLVDLVRENLTHRGTDFRDETDSIMLARDWLRKNRGVQPLDTSKRDDKIYQDIGCRQVAEFLSKNGKAITPL